MSNFSFSHSVFKRLVMQTHKNQGLFGKELMTLKKGPLQNNEKGENAGNQHFPFSHNVLVPNQRNQKSSFELHLTAVPNSDTSHLF